MIAYTSDFIPRMVYQYKYSPTEDLTGYIDASLSGKNQLILFSVLETTQFGHVEKLCILLPLRVHIQKVGC